MTIALVLISLVALVALGGLIWLLIRSKNSPLPKDAGLDRALDLLLKDTQSLKVDQKLSQESVKEVKTEMRTIAEVIADFRSRQEERDKKEEGYNFAIQSSVKNIESLFRGSKSKGAAGENILREIFKLFPPELIVFDYRVEGKPVEFGLKLPDGRIVPMDSKVVAVEEMSRLETEQNEDIRIRLIKKVELEVSKKVKEVSAYIHPPITWDRALMLIPDALYSILKESFSRAYSQSVILIPYSMAVPYILTFLDLHKRTLATYDEQQVKSFLEDLDRSLTEMETVLENQIARGNTMISNAYNEYKRLVGKVRGRMTYLAEAEKPLALKDSHNQKVTVKD
jgi:DNA recombination protein RmuC